jgi:undecaprenyl-diphosphatase
MDIDVLSIVLLQQFRNPVFDVSSICLDFLFSVPIVLGIAFLVYLGFKKRNFFVILFASLTNFALVFIMKTIIARPRPGLIISPYSMDISGFAFPSAHAAIAFMLAVLLSKYYPKYRIIFYGLAVLTAIARIYSGAHYLTDVIAGASFGMLLAWIFLINEKRLFKLEAKIHKQLKSTFKI